MGSSGVSSWAAGKEAMPMAVPESILISITDRPSHQTGKAGSGTQAFLTEG